jgi:integral membrane sensor domain MASE1
LCFFADWRLRILTPKPPPFSSMKNWVRFAKTRLASAKVVTDSYTVKRAMVRLMRHFRGGIDGAIGARRSTGSHDNARHFA